MAVAQIQVRRGTTAEWAAADPVVLAAGEQGYDTTLKRLKMGDGATAWASLPWSDYNYYTSVMKYGATGDGVTDDTDAINAAIAAIGTDETLFFPAGTYNVDDTITIDKSINVQMDGTLSYTGAGNVPCLSIGASGSKIESRKLILRVSRASDSDWTDEASVGIKLINCNQCDINIVSVTGFTIGAQCIGDAQGWAYNTAFIGILYRNKIALDLTNKSVGWCNENLFLGGRFAQSSSNHPTLDRYGVRITSQDGTYLNNNNNVFIKPSFELAAFATSGEAVPILIEHGSYNTLFKIRNEGNSTPTMRVQNASSYNMVDAGYGIVTLDDQSSVQTSIALSRGSDYINSVRTLVYNSGNLAKKACLSTAGCNIPGIHYYLSTGAVRSYGSGTSIVDDYLQITAHGIGVYIGTTNAKRLMVGMDAIAGGRIGVKCFDAAGTLLTSAGANHPYVRGAFGVGFSYATGYGGYYTSGADSTADRYFAVHDDVAYIGLMIMKGTSNIEIRNFSVYSDAPTTAWVGYEEIVPGANIGSEAPTTGTWAVGRRVINSAPTVGQPKAWICTVSGTPGTWVSEGNL